MTTFRDYLEYAEYHLKLAEADYERGIGTDRLLVPSTILAWCAVEAFVNNMLDDFNALPVGVFELHEKAFLAEQRIRFISEGDKTGQFVLDGTEYRRLEDKIFFLVEKAGGASIGFKGTHLWQKFQEFKSTRDALTHPRRHQELLLDIDVVKEYIKVAKDVIQLISAHVWKKRVEF